MDAKEFGNFIQMRRKKLGLTQGQLGEKLNVTDKAISRWERGVGFPDIQMMEPLAGALGVSLTELMQSKEEERTVIPAAEADAVLSQAMVLAAEQERRKKRGRWMKFGLIPLAMLVEMVLYMIVVLYVREPLWLGMVACGMVVGSGSGVVSLIRYVAEERYLEPADPNKGAAYQITMVMSCVGVVLLMSCLFVQAYSVLIFRWMLGLGVVLTPAAFVHWLMKVLKDTQE